ncbi:MAG: sulfatase-like hydrolase/transferase, partial [Planctomycetales bacterium]
MVGWFHGCFGYYRRNDPGTPPPLELILWIRAGILQSRYAVGRRNTNTTLNKHLQSGAFGAKEFLMRPWRHLAASAIRQCSAFGIVAATLCGLGNGTASGANKDDRPNIVFLFADDLGYGDLACYGAPDAKTPRLDQLARQGVRFTRHYANGPECSPTRAALLTGCYQHRLGGLECAIGTGNVGRYDDAIRLAEQHDLGVPADSAALPRGIKNAGYTSGAFGKWHQGYEPKFNPLNLGFDRFFGCL